MALPAFDQIVFSGGGTRCFWQGGFLHVARDPLGLDPKRISAVSGGALTAVGFVARCGEEVLRRMSEAFRAQEQNATLHDLVEDRGLTPHQEIYRDVVRDILTPDHVQAVIDGPPFEVLLGHPPEGKGKVGATAAVAAYEAELHTINSPHFFWAEKLGVSSSRIDAKQAARDGRLLDLVCAAAVIPPLFDLARWDGKDVIDGGMADQAPMPTPDAGETLILLTRAYRNIPDHDRRLYVAPQKETPADKIDFTDPDKIQRTWDIGMEAGRRFLARHDINDH
jgi:predicted acylesterase/phospholipase RssA